MFPMIAWYMYGIDISDHHTICMLLSVQRRQIAHMMACLGKTILQVCRNRCKQQHQMTHQHRSAQLLRPVLQFFSDSPKTQCGRRNYFFWGGTAERRNYSALAWRNTKTIDIFNFEHGEMRALQRRIF